METVQKFLFETCFDLDRPFEAEVEDEEPELPPAPTFSEDEIALARAQGFAEGRTEGIAEMQTALDHRTAELVETMVEQLRQLDSARAASARTAELRLLGLAGAITKKVVPPIICDTAQETVEEVIRECLPKLMDEPRVVIRVHPTLMDELRNKIDTLAAKSGFGGDLILLPDDDFSPADCLVEWADGGAEKSVTNLWSDIEKIIDAYLDTPGSTTDDDAPITHPDTEPQMPAGTETDISEEKLNG